MDPWKVISSDDTRNIRQTEAEDVKDHISSNNSSIGDNSLKASGSEIPVHLSHEPVPILHNTILPSEQQFISSTSDVENSPSQPLASFEDSFQPPGTGTITTFEKLPDSQEYLASLETKLKTLQKGGKNGKNLSSGRIIRSLEETRESYMVQLLADSLSTGLQTDNFDELKVNPILKKLAPEKQAIALEELVHLVKADQLALILDEAQDEEKSNKVIPSIEGTEQEEQENKATAQSELENNHSQQESKLSPVENPENER